MRHVSGFGLLASAMVAIILAGCSATGVPDEPGLYAVDSDGDLQRLDGSPEWERETWPERENLRPETRFVARYPETGGQKTIVLRKVGWVRSEIRSGAEIGPPQGRRWVTAPLPQLVVPVQLVNETAETVTIVPQSGALDPGLYALQVDSGGRRLQARFGVGWSTIDQKRYASAHCMDRYLDASTQYRSCATQHLPVPTDGLQIRLVDPDKRFVGEKVNLVVKGTIANTSEQKRAIPTLYGQLKDQSGRVVHRWEFASPVPELEPGAYVPFTTVAEQVPPTATDVTVSFQPLSRASLR